MKEYWVVLTEKEKVTGRENKECIWKFFHEENANMFREGMYAVLDEVRNNNVLSMDYIVARREVNV